MGFQRECYLAGITASAVFNSRRSDSSQPVLDAMEFVPRSTEEIQREEVISMLREQLEFLRPDEYAAARETWQKSLTERGLDAEEILEEVFWV